MVRNKKSNIYMDKPTISRTSINLPIVGNTYSYIDDGKLKPSRLYEVTITKIVPFSEIDKETFEYWRDEMLNASFLYANITDFFIFGKLKIKNNKSNKDILRLTIDKYLDINKTIEKEDTYDEVIFVKDIRGRYFSLGYWAGILDTDNSLTTHIYNMFK